MSAARRRPRWVAWTFAFVVLVIVGGLVFLAGGTPPITPGAPGTPEVPVDTPTSPPIRIGIDAGEVRSMDNDRLFGRDGTVPEAAADAATREVGEVLETYLNAQFVTPATRFSDQPLDDLLSRQASAALSGEARGGLGALGMSVTQVDSEPVTAEARVLTRGDEAAIVTVDYDLEARVRTGDTGAVPLLQRATMVFVRQRGDWRVDAVDATLDMPVVGSEAPR